jgi:hypothetical protein
MLERHVQQWRELLDGLKTRVSTGERLQPVGILPPDLVNPVKISLVLRPAQREQPPGHLKDFGLGLIFPTFGRCI